jgi:type I restriction enzyme S subunit
MTSVDDLLGTINHPLERPFSEVKKGYTYFIENDVIFAKITPCMENGKHAIAKNLIDGIGFGSTEFHIIRPKESIIPEWVWYFIRQPSLLQTATNYFTGAVGQQRVPDSFLKSLEIPLPPLIEQRRIGLLLNEKTKAALQARLCAGEQLLIAQNLVSAYMRGIFSKETRNWNHKTLADIVHNSKDGICRGPFGGSLKKEIFVKSGYKVYEQQHAIRNNFAIGNYYIDQFKYDEMKRFHVQPGDIIISCSGTIGRVAIVPANAEPGVINQALLKISLNPKIIIPEYFKLVFESQSTREQLSGLSSGSGLKNVASVKYLKGLIFPVPSLQRQHEIVSSYHEKLVEIKKLIHSIETQLAEINRLPAALIRKAYSGEF